MSRVQPVYSILKVRLQKNKCVMQKNKCAICFKHCHRLSAINNALLYVTCITIKRHWLVLKQLKLNSVVAASKSTPLIFYDATIACIAMGLCMSTMVSHAAKNYIHRLFHNEIYNDKLKCTSVTVTSTIYMTSDDCCSASHY